MPDSPGHYAIFGDGTIVIIKKSEATLNEEGVEQRTLGMRLTRDAMQKHQIKDSELEAETGLIYRSYPETYFDILDDNPNTFKRWIGCTFDGKPSRFMEKVSNRLFNQNINLRKELHSTKMALKSAHRKLNRMAVEPMKLAKEISKYGIEVQTERNTNG